MIKRVALVLGLVVFSAAYADTPASTLNPQIIPVPLIKAFQDVQLAAANAPLTSLYMFKYVYFNAGFCKDQDCSPATVSSSIALFKQLMGSDFPTLNQKYDLYVNEIRQSQLESKTGDADSLLSWRNPTDILTRGTFFTCIDYAKVIAAKALANGLDPRDLKFYWTMEEAAYLKMCPTRNGQAALLPRPTVHTVIAYRMKRKWYIMNSQNPNPEIIPMGESLPEERLSRRFVFPLPALVGGQVLTFAGTYDFARFIDGFPGQWIANITASGIPSSNPNDFVCW
jgi:hypothetical protein